MPGSPPSRVTEPATMPSPSTRSSSPMPVGVGRPTSDVDVGRCGVGAPPARGATGTGGSRPVDVLDERVPRIARRTLAGPLRVGGAAVGAAVDETEPGHGPHPTQGVWQRSASYERVRYQATAARRSGGRRRTTCARVRPMAQAVRPVARPPAAVGAGCCARVVRLRLRWSWGPPWRWSGSSSCSPSPA